MIIENLKIEIFSWVISGPSRITNVLLHEGGKRFRHDNEVDPGVENCYVADFEDREKCQKTMKGGDLP